LPFSVVVAGDAVADEFVDESEGDAIALLLGQLLFELDDRGFVRAHVPLEAAGAHVVA
jgi:hypothetical protein